MNSQRNSIPSGEAISVGLNDALAEMEGFPSYKEYKGGFIGFINDNDESVQFIRFDDESWFMDAPFVKRGGYAFSRQIEVSHSLAKKIVESFFLGEDLSKYFIIPQAMPRLGSKPPFFHLMVAAFAGLVVILVVSLIVRFLGLR